MTGNKNIGILISRQRIVVRAKYEGIVEK